MNDPKKVLVLGGSGLVGSSVVRKLGSSAKFIVLAPSSTDLNLLDRNKVFDFLKLQNPDVIIDAAGHVGGIAENWRFPQDFISLNLQMQVNLLDAALNNNVERFLFLGSSCIYPKYADQPIKEKSLLSGYLEESNKAYAVAKIAGITQIQAIRKQYGKNYISIMPTNLYGPNDNFGPESSHVLPGLIGKFAAATKSSVSRINLWGTGSPLREFLHVDDLASALEILINAYDDDEPINIGSGSEISIRDLAEKIALQFGYGGEIDWNSDMPDGTPRKILNSEKIRNLGWSPKISLEEGLQMTIGWYKTNYDN
jgi:GDP-L-fucose synthase